MRKNDVYRMVSIQLHAVITNMRVMGQTDEDPIVCDLERIESVLFGRAKEPDPDNKPASKPSTKVPRLVEEDDEVDAKPEIKLSNHRMFPANPCPTCNDKPTFRTIAEAVAWKCPKDHSTKDESNVQLKGKVNLRVGDRVQWMSKSLGKETTGIYVGWKDEAAGKAYVKPEDATGLKLNAQGNILLDVNRLTPIEPPQPTSKFQPGTFVWVIQDNAINPTPGLVGQKVKVKKVLGNGVYQVKTTDKNLISCSESELSAEQPKEPEAPKAKVATVVDTADRVEDMKRTTVEALLTQGTLGALGRAMTLAGLTSETKDGGKMKAALREWLAEGNGQVEDKETEDDDENEEEEEQPKKKTGGFQPHKVERVKPEAPVTDSVKGMEPVREPHWNARRKAIIMAMRKLQATNYFKAVTARAIGQMCGVVDGINLAERIDMVKVCLDVYRVEELIHNGFAKQCKHDGERELRYHLTTKGTSTTFPAKK